MRADVVVLQAVARVPAHELVLDGGQRGGVVGVDRRDLGAREDVVVDCAQRLDRLLHLRRQPGPGVAHAREAGASSLARNLVGMRDGDEGGHAPKGGVRVPHLVSRLIVGAGMRIAPLGSVVRDVADGPEPDHLAGGSQGDVLRLRLAQAAGERHVGFIGHRLLRKAEERVGVDRFANRLDDLVGQVRGQVGSRDAGAEGSVQRFDVDAAHAVSPGLIGFRRSGSRLRLAVSVRSGGSAGRTPRPAAIRNARHRASRRPVRTESYPRVRPCDRVPVVLSPIDGTPHCDHTPPLCFRPPR